MDDLGDDSVQVAVRIARETFEMWMRRPKDAGQGRAKSAAQKLAREVESGDVRAAGVAEAEDCGWKQITLASTDLEGIQSRLEERGVLFQVNERLDGDIDVYFKADSEEAIKEALADIIANEALSLDEQEPDGPQAGGDKRCEPIKDQIEDAKRSEASREGARAEEARERAIQQGIER